MKRCTIFSKIYGYCQPNLYAKIKQKYEIYNIYIRDFFLHTLMLKACIFSDAPIQANARKMQSILYLVRVSGFP